MLEHPSLLLRPWTTTKAEYRVAEDGTDEALREILDPATGRLLGRVRRRSRRGSWFRWLTRPVLAVHEAIDDPLVFTVERLWSLTSSWEVLDADRHSIAFLRRDWIIDPLGDCLAWMERQASASVSRICGRDGRELARWELIGENRELHFAPDVWDQPFLKMAIMGAALTRLSEPGA